MQKNTDYYKQLPYEAIDGKQFDQLIDDIENRKKQYMDIKDIEMVAKDSVYDMFCDNEGLCSM